MAQPSPQTLPASPLAPSMVPDSATSKIDPKPSAVWQPREPSTKHKRQKREREQDDLVVETLMQLPAPEATAELRVQTAVLEEQVQTDPPAKRHKALWRPPPAGTAMFQISMEKLQTKPVKTRRTQRRLDNLMEFGDPEQTLREEKDRIKEQKHWHKEVDVRRRAHRKGKKERLEAWMAANSEAKRLQDEALAKQAAEKAQEEDEDLDT